jgi:hypothetical protein
VLLFDASCNRVQDYTRIVVQRMDIFLDETTEHRVGLGTSIVRLIRARGGVESRLTLYQIC